MKKYVSVLLVLALGGCATYTTHDKKALLGVEIVHALSGKKAEFVNRYGVRMEALHHYDGVLQIKRPSQDQEYTFGRWQVSGNTYCQSVGDREKCLYMTEDAEERYFFFDMDGRYISRIVTMEPIQKGTVPVTK